MKKAIVAFVLAMGIVFASLAGCANANSDKAPKLEPPYGLTGSVTMGEYMGCHVEGFDEYATGLADGSRPANQLEVFAVEDLYGYVTEQDLIKQAFDELAQVRIDVDHPVGDLGILDGDISFTFEWDGRAIQFNFLTTQYATFGDNTMYEVQNPAAVKELLDELRDHVHEPGEPEGDVAQKQGSSYQWDADGDDSYERLEINYIDQGDEAPSVMKLTLYSGDKVIAEGSIDRAYKIQMAIVGKDDKGTYVQVHYLSGDYYQHDSEAACTLRLVDGELVTT